MIKDERKIRIHDQHGGLWNQGRVKPVRGVGRGGGRRGKKAYLVALPLLPATNGPGRSLPSSNTRGTGKKKEKEMIRS